MKKVLVLGLMAALALYGCQVEQVEDFTSGNSRQDKIFTASTEEFTNGGEPNAETRTTLNSRGNVLWKGGDQVSIFVGSTINEHYQVTEASDGKASASLVQVTNPGFVAGIEIDNNVAFYPYASTIDIDKDGSLYILDGVSLPETQVYARESFGNGTFPMAAVTNSKKDMNLKFMNVIGGLKLQLTGSAIITSISIKGNNNEILCGDAEVRVSNTAAPSITLTDASAKAVTLDCGNGVALDATTATAFIIALPPVTMTNGFTVKVIDSDGKQMEIKTTKSQTIARSNLLSMPTVTYVGSEYVPEGAVDLGLPSGLKWASCNLGASVPEEFGDYYAWGDTEPYYEEGYEQSDNPVWKDGKTGYNLASYKWHNGSSYTKYILHDYFGDVDYKYFLEPEDDAAHVRLGGAWRIPTDIEWSELIDNCTSSWTTQNGVNGMLVIGPNGNSIFLPAVRSRIYDSLWSGGSYWSSILVTSYEESAVNVNVSSTGMSISGHAMMFHDLRWVGNQIRPVTDEGVRVLVTDVTLDKNNISIIEGESSSLSADVTPSNATQPLVTWSSGDRTIATVDINGTITAVGEGTTTITASTYDGVAATCLITVISNKRVDLGLPSGLIWASCNLCESGFVSSPEEYGDYYAWGETEPYYITINPLKWKEGKPGYFWQSYKWCEGSSSTLTKYTTSSSYGTLDNKTVLDLEDDAAHVILGHNWRMPTDEEWTELRENCNWTWTTMNGEIGDLVTGPNGNSIFLPATNRLEFTYINGPTAGLYWSSSLLQDSPDGAVGVLFDYSGVMKFNQLRCSGLSVRPVTE